MSESAVTLIVDIGKTRTKLLALDADGGLLESWHRDSESVMAAEGYLALDTHGTEAWLRHTLSAMGSLRQSVRTIVPVTHGAALAGIEPAGLALPVADYEFPGFDDRAPDFAARAGDFDETLSPVLPQGLNAAAQLHWLQRRLPDRFESARLWMPYAQYWAWWLSGVPSSEVSSLGCHSLLWNPRAGHWSRLAPVLRMGGAVRADSAGMGDAGGSAPGPCTVLGLPRGVQVLCGAHDSNACLARYLRSWPRMTLVSSGTWVVVMAPGTPLTALDGEGDFLANVSVRGDAVPTGRFMGGRDIERICAGARPEQASRSRLRELVGQGFRIAGAGHDLRLPDGRAIAIDQAKEILDAEARATVAAWHAALRTVHCTRTLGALGPITVDGPLSSNDVYLEVLATQLPDVNASVDAIEGTARGGYVLSRWTEPGAIAPLVRAIDSPADAAALHPAFMLAA